MHLTFPSMSDHGVSPTLGFLPPEAPLKSLPSYFSAWDGLASNIPTAIAAKSLRSDIARLPIISAAKLTNQAQLHRAFVVLGFLVHAYVWCDGSDRPEPNVPAQLGEPYVEVCERLGMQPTLSYAGLCLWNWQIIAGKRINGEMTNGAMEPDSDVKLALANLDNLECLVSFTGTRDEAVFYLVPVMVEAEGARLVKLLLDAAESAVRDGDPASIIQALEETKDNLPRMTALIKLLHEQCNAKTFYQKVRPFYPGAKGMEAKGMPDGVAFQRSDGTKVNAKCVGGSAAQSSLFPFIDSALGVRHRPVGDDEGETVFQVGILIEIRCRAD
jgi:indoleamine 2,3-dioxygenase